MFHGFKGNEINNELSTCLYESKYSGNISQYAMRPSL